MSCGVAQKTSTPIWPISRGSFRQGFDRPDIEAKATESPGHRAGTGADIQSVAIDASRNNRPATSARASSQNPSPPPLEREFKTGRGFETRASL
jgi:hypothetical protein